MGGNGKNGRNGCERSVNWELIRVNCFFMQGKYPGRSL